MTAIRNTRRKFCQNLLALPFVAAIGQAYAATTLNFKPVSTQYLAVLGEPHEKSGTGAEKWGLWELDPGPRGVRLRNYEDLIAAGGVAPAGWKYDANDWWLEENGLIMEPPVFGIKAGRYLVTGDRTVRSILTVFAADAEGKQRWELADNATIYDVTHLRCRSARYTPRADVNCLPTTVLQSDFPLGQAAPMPLVGGCDKQEYAVLFIIGVEV